MPGLSCPQAPGILDQGSYGCLLHCRQILHPWATREAHFFFFYFNSKKSRLTVKAKKQIIGKHGKTNYEDLNHNSDILAKFFYFFLPSLFLFPQLGWVLRIYIIFSSRISPYSIWTYINFLSGFTRGSDGKGSACNEGDLVSVPGLGGYPGGGHGNPLQNSCLENPHGQRSLAGYSHRLQSVRHDWATKHNTTQISFHLNSFRIRY